MRYSSLGLQRQHLRRRGCIVFTGNSGTEAADQLDGWADTRRRRSATINCIEDNCLACVKGAIGDQTVAKHMVVVIASICLTKIGRVREPDRRAGLGSGSVDTCQYNDICWVI